MYIVQYLFQIVPIPMVKQRCKNGMKCCYVTLCPLVVAFGRTIHTFQGQEAGPNQPIPVVVIDPGDKSFESRSPGTLYCCITRGTTFGKTIDGIKHRDSAVYFTGENIHRKRFSDMIYNINGELYKDVDLRMKWIQHLQRQLHHTDEHYTHFKTDMMHDLNNQFNKQISMETLDKVIQYHNTN